jgi:hypothetical protein
MPHISIQRMLTALEVYIQMYRGCPCRAEDQTWIADVPTRRSED